MKHSKDSLRARGLFGKLLVTFAGLGLAIALSFAISFRLFSNNSHKHAVHKNMKSYAAYIAQDIGAPPNIKIAKQRAEELGLVIGVFGNKLNYKSSPEMPSLADQKDLSKSEKNGFLRKHHIIVVQKNGYKYAFGIDKTQLNRPLTPLIIAVLLSLIFVMIAYHLVEKMFKPLQDIKLAADEYAKGNFSYKLKPIGSGLLPELSSSIGEMAEKIQTMLEAKRELLLAIAHELRTPITRAKLHIEFVDDEKLKAKISEELDEMSQQVTDILEGERIKSGHNELVLKPTSLAELIKEVVKRNFANIDSINLNLDQNLNLEIDPVKYGLVIKNLLSNAVRHGQDRPIEVVLSDGQLSVINQGIAIPAGELEHITEAFYRVEKSRDRESGGVGLGLYLVSQILQAHGHRLEIKSDEATSFTIHFEVSKL